MKNCLLFVARSGIRLQANVRPQRALLAQDAGSKAHGGPEGTRLSRMQRDDRAIPTTTAPLRCRFYLLGCNCTGIESASGTDARQGNLPTMAHQNILYLRRLVSNIPAPSAKPTLTIHCLHPNIQRSTFSAVLL